MNIFPRVSYKPRSPRPLAAWLYV